MSILTTAKTNTPSKVHFTEYIVTANAPKESRQSDAIRTYMVFQGRALFMKTMVRFFHV